MNFTEKMKNVTCPNCGNHGKAASPIEMLEHVTCSLNGDMDSECNCFSFRQRGHMQGYPIWVCNSCNNGAVWMKIGFFGKPKATYTGIDFEDLRAEWEMGTGLTF